MSWLQLRRRTKLLIAFLAVVAVLLDVAYLAGCSSVVWSAITAIATLLLAFVAIFQDWLRRWLVSPELRLEAVVAPPACHRTIQKSKSFEIPCYYFRVNVINEGDVEAREVELYASALKRKGPAGFTEVSRFTPMNLLWAHWNVPFLQVLTPKIPKMCDLVYVLHPDHRRQRDHVLPEVPDNKAIMAFCLLVEPNMKGHLAEPGSYRLTVTLAAANCAPQDYTIEIEFPGDWYGDEGQSLRDGFSMRLV